MYAEIERKVWKAIEKRAIGKRKKRKKGIKMTGENK